MAQYDRISSFSEAELEDLFFLAQRLMGDYRDPRRGSFKFGFIYANVPDSESSSFLRAIELANSGQIDALAISEGSHEFGYAGFDHSVQRLNALGWTNKVPIVKFVVDANVDGVRNVNTGSEARKLAEYAKSIAGGGSNGGDIAIIAPPFHIVRAFITTITALWRRNDKIPVRVYAVCGVPLPWTEMVGYGQALQLKTRREMLADELARIEKYRAPEFGGLLSAQEVIKYLNWRDC